MKSSVLTHKQRNLFVILCLWIYSSFAQNTNQSYLTEPAKFNNQLLQNTVTGLAKDEAGMLWAVTQYGCYRYDGFNTSIFVSSNTAFLSSDRYRSIFQDNANSRLIAVGENDYYFIKDRRLTKKANSDSVLFSNSLNFLLVPRNRLQKITSNGKSLIKSTILFFNSDTLVLNGKNCFNYSQNKIIKNEELNILENEQLVYKNGRNYWLKKSGLYEIGFEQGKITTKIIIPLIGPTHIIPNNDEHAIWIENDHEVKKINPITGAILINFNKPNSIIYSQSILEDESTNLIYLGSVKKGVMVIRPNKISTLASENYTSSYAFNNRLNSYIVATNNGITFFNNKKQAAVLPQKDILNIYVYTDSQQRIWYQTIQGGIRIINPADNKIMYSLPFDDFMVNVKQLDSVNFLICNHNSIFTLNLKEKKLKPLFTPKDKAYIYDFCFYNKSICVSTNNGIYIVDDNQKIINHFLAGVSIRKSIKLNNNMLAIGSYGKGFYLLKNNKLYAASTDKYPQLSAVVSLSLDADSALWVICNKGAFVWNKPDVKEDAIANPDHALYVETDLPCDELNGGLMPDVFPNSQIVLPSSEGLLVFNKRDLIKKTTDIKINIGKVLLNDSVLNNVSDFSIPAGTQSVRFMIDAANLDYHSTLVAQYRIKALDSNWTTLPEQRVIEFSRLPRGKYELEFRNKINDKPFVLSRFKVLPFWYESLWAWILFIFLFILLVYGIIKIRIRSQQRYQKKLERIIEEKTKTLQENITKLNTSENALKKQYRHRNKLYSILMHDIKSPLTFLSTYSIQQLSKKQPVEKESMRVIAKSSSELSSFINEFLYWLGNQNNQDSISIQKINVSELLDELTNFYQSFASINNNKIFYFDKSKNIVFKTDPDRLKIIVRNLLDNANKYTNNGIIKISSNLDNKNCLEVTIEDSGKGIPENITTMVNSAASTDEITPSINANHKMGLMITKELTCQLRGTISVTSSENTGTVFTLRFEQ